LDLLVRLVLRKCLIILVELGKITEKPFGHNLIPTVESDNMGVRGDDFFIEELYEIFGCPAQQLTEAENLFGDLL
jgi:hypothetical protein